MEYCEKGSVQEKLTNQKFLTEDQISVIAKDVLLGLEYLHKNLQKIHGSIKASHIFINENNICKLSNSGGVPPTFEPPKTRFIGTPYWMVCFILFYFIYLLFIGHFILFL